MKIKPVLLCLLILFSCSREKSVVIEKIAEELLIYQHVLTELVEHDFYNLYLGEEEVYTLREKYIYPDDDPDTVSYDSEIEKLRKIVESDSSRRRGICLTNKFTAGPWAILKSGVVVDTATMLRQLRDVIGILPQPEPLADSLTKAFQSLDIPQAKYQAVDFTASTFNIGSLQNSKKCEIGTIGFSKVLLAKGRDQAILYYEFHCGEKCGKGEILLIKKMSSKWTISSKRRMWIS